MTYTQWGHVWPLYQFPRTGSLVLPRLGAAHIYFILLETRVVSTVRSAWNIENYTVKWPEVNHFQKHKTEPACFPSLQHKQAAVESRMPKQVLQLSAPSHHSSSNRAHLQITLLLTQQTLQLCRRCLYPFLQLLFIMCSLQMTFLLWNRGKLLAELLSLLHEPIAAVLPSCGRASQWPHRRTSKAGIWRTEWNFIAK